MAAAQNNIKEIANTTTEKIMVPVMICCIFVFPNPLFSIFNPSLILIHFGMIVIKVTMLMTCLGASAKRILFQPEQFN